VRAEVTPELLLELLRPGEVELSRDGARVAFTVAPSCREQGEPLLTRLWVGDVDGAPAPRGEPGASEALPRYSPDGARLAFACDRGHTGRMSLWLDDRELGTIHGSVEEIRWSPDGQALLVLAADLGSDRAGAATATKIQEAGAAEDDPKVRRPAQHWRRLWLVDAATGDTREAGPEGVNVFELGWAGGKVAAICTDEPSEGAWYDAWIGLIDLDSRTVERIHTPQWQLQCPRISAGGRVAWIEGFASDRYVVCGTVHVLGVGPLAPELDVTWINFAGENTLCCAGRRRSASFIGRLAIDGSFEEVAGGDFLIGHRFGPVATASADGSRFAATFESPEDPNEVVLFDHTGRRALTSLNASASPALRSTDWRAYRWESFDRLEIEGLLAVPRGHNGVALPLLVLVHGGPTDAWPWAFTLTNGLPQLLASAGYACLLPNPRGSQGRGPEFAQANLGDMGGGDLQDILAGIDALVRDGIVDDARVAIAGGSYGGFMSSWAVTQTDRFAAAIPYAVVTNWLSFHNTTNVGQFDRLFLQADPYDPAGEYVKRSPVYHAHKCHTPTLILHGEVDLCTPVSQATEFYNALVEAGCETELVVYPREGHGWTEREHHIDAWSRIHGWLERHMR
jgi:dipeptidyl aminopeptidase/acylaminoacyl peptidase